MVYRVAEEDRELVESLGAIVCWVCSVPYMPMDGYLNEGHQCGIDGTADEFIIDPAFLEDHPELDSL